MRPSTQVFCGLAHLPVGVGERACDRGFDLGPVERREGEHRAPSDGRSIACRGEHGGDVRRITDGTERGDRGFAYERVGVRDRHDRERRARFGIGS